ncbi:hypothetical protein HMPREF9413_4314 [Paenibacillus sp. HGF7]|nr:hypothetical protein HMPREF9413_4314 [Paenibacillus sp. HGF7]
MGERNDFQAVKRASRIGIPAGNDLDERFMLDNPYTRKRDTSYAEVLFQVANHGTYHRGNLSAMLRQIGQSSVMTEYALYWYTE